MLHAHRARGARVHDRHRRAVPRDIRDLAQDRGPLRPARGGRGRHAAERHAVERLELLRRRARSTRSSARWPAPTAWITGIRREQSPTRASAEAIEWDESRGVWKFNPLADWTDAGRVALRQRARSALPSPARPGAMRRSAAPPARFPATAARVAGPGRTRPSAVCTFERDPRRYDLRDLTPPRPRVRGHPRDPRGRGGARARRAAVLRRQGLARCCSTWPARRSTRAASRSPSCTWTPATTSPR